MTKKGDGRVGEGVYSTPQRAHLSRVTHAIFLVCTWLKFRSPCSGQDRWIVVLASLQSRSISSMLHGTLLDPQLSPHFLYAVSFTCTWFVNLSFVVKSCDVSLPLPLCKEGYTLADWLNNPPSPQVTEPKSLIEVSQRTHRSTCFREKGSLDTNLDDLAITADASEV